MNHSLKTLCPCRYNILRRCEVADFVPEIWQVADFSCEICRNYQKPSCTGESFDRRVEKPNQEMLMLRGSRRRNFTLRKILRAPWSTLGNTPGFNVALRV